MRLIAFALLLTAGLSALAETENLQDAKYYQSFSSTVDAQMTLVPASREDHVYLHFENFGGELDDFVGLYQLVRETSRADANIRYQLVGTSSAHLRNHHHSTLLAGSRVEYLEALPPDSAPVKLFLAGRADIYQARKVLEDYRHQQGLRVSRIAVNKLLREQQAEAEEACGQDMVLTLGDFSDKTTPGLLQGHLQSLARLCREDEDYRAAINAIREIVASEAKQATGHQLSVDGERLRISLGHDTANTAAASYEMLRRAL